MNPHFVSNLLVAGLYLVISLFLIKTVITHSSFRNALIFSMASVFILLSLIFGTYAFLKPVCSFFGFELFALLLAGLPAVFFIFQIPLLVGQNAITPAARFNQMKDEFLSVASHELRTPLSVINGFAEILVREKLGPLNDEQKRRVRKILQQGQRLNRIVDELLDLSRIRSGKVEIRQQVFDLVPVLKACLDDHLIVCDQQKIQMVDSVPDVLPDVLGDLERVTQVVVNLLNNAIKYTTVGGTVTLAAYFNQPKNEVTVEVRDTGIGIDPKDQARIFEEFYRANDAYARKLKGSGLGLAIVKQLVEAQGGRVGLHSEGSGKGCSFFFTLPPSNLSKVQIHPKSVSSTG